MTTELAHQVREFNSLTDEDHVAKSPCFVCKIGLVTEFPTDEMHLVYLGVMRRFITFWLQGPIEWKCRLPGQSVCMISDQLLGAQRYMCSEFVRTLCLVSEVDRWKATEFRSLLLYVGPIIFVSVRDELACSQTDVICDHNMTEYRHRVTLRCLAKNVSLTADVDVRLRA